MTSTECRLVGGRQRVVESALRAGHVYNMGTSAHGHHTVLDTSSIAHGWLAAPSMPPWLKYDSEYHTYTQHTPHRGIVHYRTSDMRRTQWLYHRTLCGLYTQCTQLSTACSASYKRIADRNLWDAVALTLCTVHFSRISQNSLKSSVSSIRKPTFFSGPQGGVVNHALARPNPSV